MGIIMGVKGQLGGTQRGFQEENVKVATAATTYSGLTTRSLAPGTYLIHVDFAPGHKTHKEHFQPATKTHTKLPSKEEVASNRSQRAR